MERAEESAGRQEERPWLSVVVPFYNSEAHIGACIEALLGQAEVEATFELIFVDNRSEDRSAEIVAGYEGLTVLEEETPGAYAARNTGIRRARAPIIAFTDADCVVDRNWLQSIRAGLEEASIGVLVGHCRYPAEASGALRLLSAYENAKAEYVIEHCPAANHFAYANNMAVRSSVFEELGLFREWRRAADSELVHRMAARRPDLRLAYRASMRVEHREFLQGRARAQRLSLYTQTNAQIETFRELRLAQRLGVLAWLLRRRHPASPD